MATAKILVGGVPGSNVDVAIGTTLQLSNDDSGGEVSYLWEFVDKPAASTDTYSDDEIENPTLQLNTQGSCKLLLTVNAGLASEVTDSVTVAVRQIRTDNRVPAGGETTDANALKGWSLDVNKMLRDLDSKLVEGVVLAGIAEVDISKGTVCYVVEAVDWLTGKPEAQRLHHFNIALGDTPQYEALYLCVGAPDGSLTASAGTVGLFRKLGLFASASPAYTGAVGDAVYVSDTGTLSDTPGTFPRRVGTVLELDPPTIDFDGGRLPTPFELHLAATANPAAGATSYMRVGAQSLGSTADYPFVMSRRGVLRSLRVYVATPGHDATLTFTVRKNGSTTGLALALVAADGSADYTGDPVAFEPGDRINVSIASAGGLTANATAISVTVEGVVV